MTKNRDGVIPRSRIEVRIPPGAATPRSGIHEKVGPRGGRTGRQAVSTKGRPLPPAGHSEPGWTLVKSARQKDQR